MLSPYLVFKETTEKECKGNLKLWTVMARLITTVVDRASEYYSPYTKTEIEDYLRENSNILPVQFEIFREKERELEWSSILIIQGATVIRPTQYSMLPIALRYPWEGHRFGSSNCEESLYKLEGTVTFNTSDLNADAPFQIKIIEGGRDTAVFDIDPPDSLSRFMRY